MAAVRAEILIPRSLHSDIPTYVEFCNRAGEVARAWWLDFNGNPVCYGDISPGNHLRMNTYVTHPWVFRNALNDAKLLVNLEDVYFPEPPVDEDGETVFRQVVITSPVYSLKDYCSMLIRKLVKEADFKKLEIAESLKEDLKEAPSLEQELRQLNAAHNVKC
ncbi:von Hippel-Lindau-like protein [Polypterus senegalus]